MRISSLLLLVGLSSCTPADQPFLGTWEILQATGRPHDLFRVGSTLQFTADSVAWVTTPGREPVRRPWQTYRTFAISDRDELIVHFEGDDQGYIVRMPTRTELQLEENELEAAILTLRRTR